MILLSLLVWQKNAKGIFHPKISALPRKILMKLRCYVQMGPSSSLDFRFFSKKAPILKKI